MRKIIIIFVLTFILGCASDKVHTNYLHWVGDSVPDAQLDRPEFALCHGENRVKQYFNIHQGLAYHFNTVPMDKIYLADIEQELVIAND